MNIKKIMSKKRTQIAFFSIATLIISITIALYRFKPQEAGAVITIDGTKATGDLGVDFFYDRYSWSESEKFKSGDSLRQMLELLPVVPVEVNGYEEFQTAAEFVDINGDGLSDFLYFQQYKRGGEIKILSRKYAVLENTGDTFEFERVYKCEWSSIWSGGIENTFAGDCADDDGEEVNEIFIQQKFKSAHVEPAFFDDHRAWQSSIHIDSSDMSFNILRSMDLQDYSMPSFEIRNAKFTDLNGDSRVDVAFFQHSVGLRSLDIDGEYDPDYYAVFLNKGGLEFEPVYMCYHGDESGKYYGDCAQQ